MTHEHPWSEGAFAGGAEGGSNQISNKTTCYNMLHCKIAII